MNNNIKIPRIVKISFGLVIAESVLAVLWFSFMMIYSYGEVKWCISATFISIIILLHIVLAFTAYAAVIQRQARDSKGIGFLMLIFSLIFLALLVADIMDDEPVLVEAVIGFTTITTFFCFNGIIFLYWARQIKKIGDNNV